MMNNQFVVRLQSGEDKPSAITNQGMLVEGFKQEDDSNDSNILNDKDIIILNDSDFSLVPSTSDGGLVNYNVLDKIEPITIQTSAGVFNNTSNMTNAIQAPLNPSLTPTNTIILNQPIANTQTVIPTTSSSALHFAQPMPLIPISTTLTTDAHNQTITTTNYEIVDTISNQVSIPDVVGDGTAFGGMFSGMATFSDEQMQQLLDATAITVADVVITDDGQQEIENGDGQRQQDPTLQLCTAPATSSTHQPLRDITNTLNMNALQAPSTSVTTTTGNLGQTFANLHNTTTSGGGVGDLDGGLTDYGMFIKSEGLQMDDLDVPHFVRQRYVDGKQAKIWQCGVCEKEFGHQYILMRHLPTHTDERKFQCTVCGKAFRQMSTLSQHRAIHSADRPYICEICDKTFNRVSTLISHRKTHTGLKPHQCHLCNKAFHQKGNLRNHIFTHTNERPYKCDICHKGFNQMSNLMCHKLKAHQRADKPKYNCQTCGKEFQKRMGLRNHEQYEHGENGTIGANPTQRIKYTNGVLIDRINTAAMQLAIDTNEIPFALLRPLNGIPVLVRALPAGEKQLLVPATADDLKRHGHITIGGKPNMIHISQDNGLKPGGGVVDIKTVDIDNRENKSSKVQIRIPVVATVVQRMDKDGLMRMDVESPGPTPMENYGPHEINITQTQAPLSLLQVNGDKQTEDNEIIIETTSLLKPHPKPSAMTDDNMDVEPPTSSNRIIERNIPIASNNIQNNDSVISDYFDLTSNVNDSVADDITESASDRVGKRSDEGQFDSGVFSGDGDHPYCEMFEILHKDDDITAVDLTGDDNPISF